MLRTRMQKQDSAALRRNLFRRSMVAGQPPQSSGRRRDTDEAQARFGLWALGRVLWREFGCCGGGASTLEVSRPYQGIVHLKSRQVKTSYVGA